MSVTDAFAPAPPSGSLKVLSDAIGGARSLGPSDRVVATLDSRSPDEGLALLAAYTSIADRHLRQAILDVVVTLSHATCG